jgi:hypothetical protein
MGRPPSNGLNGLSTSHPLPRGDEAASCDYSAVTVISAVTAGLRFT